LLEAAFWLFAARCALLVLRFSWIARRLGQIQAHQAPEPSGIAEQNAARQVAWAIDRAASALPFRLVCLPRALAAWKMLNRRSLPWRIHFGVSRSPEEKALRTHAWVDACGVEVCGYPEAHRCAEIGCYARESASISKSGNQRHEGSGCLSRKSK
jgi:hypothetical protein